MHWCHLTVERETPGNSFLKLNSVFSNLQAVSNRIAFCLKTHEGLTHQFDFVVQQWRKVIGPRTHIILGKHGEHHPQERRLNFFTENEISCFVHCGCVWLLTPSDHQRVSEVSGNQRCNLCRPLRLPHFPQSIRQQTLLHGWQLQELLRTSKTNRRWTWCIKSYISVWMMNALTEPQFQHQQLKGAGMISVVSSPRFPPKIKRRTALQSSGLCCWYLRRTPVM